jgi:hypothetical protein
MPVISPQLAIALRYMRAPRDGPDASKCSRAVEVRIRCLCPSGADDEFEFIGRLAADLGELTAPISDD